MESKARKLANKRWKEKNKKKQDYYRGKSAAKKFISKQATKADLRILIKIVHNRLTKD